MLLPNALVENLENLEKSWNLENVFENNQDQYQDWNHENFQFTQDFQFNQDQDPISTTYY